MQQEGYNKQMCAPYHDTLYQRERLINKLIGVEVKNGILIGSKFFCLFHLAVLAIFFINMLHMEQYSNAAL